VPRKLLPIEKNEVKHSVSIHILKEEKKHSYFERKKNIHNFQPCCCWFKRSSARLFNVVHSDGQTLRKRKMISYSLEHRLRILKFH